MQLFGVNAWAFAGFVVFVFSYLAYQRAQSQPPMMFGPHECGACRRIIYGADCPYCEKPKQEIRPRPPAIPDPAEEQTAATETHVSSKSSKDDAKKVSA